MITYTVEDRTVQSNHTVTPPVIPFIFHLSCAWSRAAGLYHILSLALLCPSSLMFITFTEEIDLEVVVVRGHAQCQTAAGLNAAL